MAIELASFGIKAFIDRWVEAKKKIKEGINEYLKAAAKDNYIKNIDAVILKNTIFELIKTSEGLNKSVKKAERNIDPLIDFGKEYILLLKQISNKLAYEQLNNILRLQGTVQEISFGKIEIKSDFEEIALVCIYVADVLLKWIYDIFLDLKHIEINYDVSKKGIEFLKTAQNVLTRKRNVDDKLKQFVNSYLMIYKSTAQYFLCRIKLRDMNGINQEIESVANGFNSIVRKMSNLVDETQEYNLNQQYILSAQMILEHSTALLCQITAVKFNVRGFTSFKRLAELTKSIEEKEFWYYDEWKHLHKQLKTNWGFDKFKESDIDYSIGTSVNPFYDSNSKFDNEIEEISSFNFD